MKSRAARIAAMKEDAKLNEELNKIAFPPPMSVEEAV